MAKKTTRKTSPRKAPAARKAASKKTASVKKKASARKKTTARKATAKKKTAARKAPAKKKTTARKATAKKKTAARKSPARKKTTARKATAKKKTATKKAADAPKASDASSAPSSPRRRSRKTVLEAAMAADADQRGYVIVNGRRVRRISVSVEPATKRKKTSAAAKTRASSRPKKKAKSRLKAEDLKEFRRLLLAKRREVLQALDAMETEALRLESGETSTMPIHMADVGSDAYDQDLKLGISASERERIREIDAALQRIKDGTYGICEESGKAIRKARLRAKPWARMTIDSAREMERTGRRR